MSKHFSLCIGGNSGLEIITTMHTTLEKLIEEVNASDIGLLLVDSWNDHARAMNRLPQTKFKFPMKYYGDEIDFKEFVEAFPCEVGWSGTRNYYGGNAHHFEFFNISVHELDEKGWRNV